MVEFRLFLMEDRGRFLPGRLDKRQGKVEAKKKQGEPCFLVNK